MTKRMIDTRIWEDNWFSSLDQIEQLVFIYLLTNPMTNIVGAYEISKNTICRATGLEIMTLNEILKRFGVAKKVFYVEGYVILPNFIKHQNYNSPKIQKGIEIEINRLPTEVKKLLQIPYAYGMDTISHLIKLNTKGIQTISINKKPKLNTKGYKVKNKDAVSRILELFSLSTGGSFNNRLHIEVIDHLVSQHGVDEVCKRAEFGLSLSPKEFQVQISKPVDLGDHWQALGELMEKPVRSRYGIEY